MNALKLPTRQLPKPTACAETPIETYIAILRSYLSVEQKVIVRHRVESLCLRRQGMITPMRYIRILQSYLTPWQKAGVAERLELAFSRHG